MVGEVVIQSKGHTPILVALTALVAVPVVRAVRVANLVRQRPVFEQAHTDGTSLRRWNDVPGNWQRAYPSVRGGSPAEWIVKLIGGAQGQQFGKVPIPLLLSGNREGLGQDLGPVNAFVTYKEERPASSVIRLRDVHWRA